MGKARGHLHCDRVRGREASQRKGALQDRPAHRLPPPLHTIHSVVVHTVDLAGVLWQGKEGTSSEGRARGKTRYSSKSLLPSTAPLVLARWEKDE